MLADFLEKHRDVIERRTSEVFRGRSVPRPSNAELQRGIPIFMEQLIETLRRGGPVENPAIKGTATGYGERLFQLGFTVSELVHGYGSVCEVVTKLAGELGYEIRTSDFQIFNGALDVAIAEAATAHERAHDEVTNLGEAERIGGLAHELRNTLAAAALSFEVIKKGTVGVSGPTANTLDRSLKRMKALVDRSLAEVRLDTDSVAVPERVLLEEVLDQIQATMRREIEDRGLRLTLTVEDKLEVHADRQFLMSALSNIVQNALKYSRPGGLVSVRARIVKERVLFEVEDECGGMPPGKLEELSRPFVRAATKRPGVGLGLSIVKRAVKALGGELRIQDKPGNGCIFTVDLPRTPPPESAARDPRPSPPGTLANAPPKHYHRPSGGASHDRPREADDREGAAQGPRDRG